MGWTSPAYELSGGGKGGSSGPTNSQLETSQVGLADQLTSILKQQGGESQQLFNLAFPGMQQSEQFYSALASGSPDLIAKVTAPAAQQVQAASTGAKKNILQTSPAGGERNLALEQVDVNQGAQLGALASQGYTGSFNALSSMGQSGVGLGQGAAGTAISAGGAAGQGYGNVIQEKIQQKGATLGAVGQGVGDIATMALAFA